FALLVSDRFQGRGLGMELLRRLLDVGRGEKVGRITADILQENGRMQRLCDRLGFRLVSGADASLVKAEMSL
ncbi:MAG TPA: GNAT family N-acetyltransferase, partial [Gemmataceae bacterium]|nr:GNAT family N-acetyltransferase [Gemmataceae bacterium]